jgi:hypothetical protein
VGRGGDKSGQERTREDKRGRRRKDPHLRPVIVETKLNTVVTNHVVIEAKFLTNEGRGDFHHRFTNLEVVIITFFWKRICKTDPKTRTVDEKMSCLSQTSKTSTNNEHIKGLLSLIFTKNRTGKNDEDGLGCRCSFFFSTNKRIIHTLSANGMS